MSVLTVLFACMLSFDNRKHYVPECDMQADRQSCNAGASGQEQDQRLRQECSCIDQLVNPWSPGLEMHLQACARLSSLQVSK